MHAKYWPFIDGVFFVGIKCLNLNSNTLVMEVRAVLYSSALQLKIFLCTNHKEPLTNLIIEIWQWNDLKTTNYSNYDNEDSKHSRMYKIFILNISSNEQAKQLFVYIGLNKK